MLTMRQLVFSLLVVVFATAAVNGFKRVCYVSNWSQYRPGAGQFKQPNVNSLLCDYVIFAFAKIDGNTLAPYEWNDESTDWSVGNFEQLNKQKQTNPALKTLLAVGGWNFGTEGWSSVIESPNNRAAFVSQAISYLRQWGFDGLDLDFEYPGSRGSPAQDKQYFTSFVSDLRSAFNSEGASTGRTPLMLTAAVAAGKNTIDLAYEIPQISQYVDFFNLMTYDFNGAWDNVTGHNSPLYARSAEKGTEREYLNLDWAARYWVGLGAPKDKLVIGVATYGRCFQLTDSSNNGLGAPVKGPCTAGQFTREAGFLSYYEICSLLGTSGTVRVYSDEHQAPYLYYGDQWIGYDDTQSLGAKVNYIKSNGFGGWLVWNIDLDDFGGTFCGQGPYPLLTFLNQELNGYVPTPASTDAPATNAPTAALTQAPGEPAAAPDPGQSQSTQTPGSGSFCSTHSDGIHANPDDCKSYYNCANGIDNLTQCQSGLYFDDSTLVCNWPQSLTPERKTTCGITA